MNNIEDGVTHETEGSPVSAESQNASEISEEPASSRSSSRNSSASKGSSPGPMPQHRYSREKLIELSKCPLALKIPNFLEASYFDTTSGKWDPEKWFMNKRGFDSVPEETRLKRERPDLELPLSHKRRTSDPRERVKEEKDEIILSPQRRSFGTGCHVIPQSSFPKRPGSPANTRDNDNSFREPARRIGSGRMINRDRDWERDHREYYNSRTDRRDRFDQDDNEKENRRYSNRYGRGRMRSGHERIDEEEPEWFSGGPTSQSETIELVGFEESENDHETKKSGRKFKKNRDTQRKQSLKSEETEKIEKPPTPPVEKVVEKQPEPEPVVKTKTPSPEPDDQNGTVDEPKPVMNNFDLDDLFKMEWLIPKESPPDNSSNEIGCSRFSQWFQRDSPLLPSEDNSQRSSLHEDFLAHVLSDKHAITKSIEADLKRLVLGENQQQSSEDTSAFSRLVQHINDNSSSISMGPMDKSKALQEDELLQNILGSKPLSPMQSRSNAFPAPHNSGDVQPNHIQMQQSDLYNKIMQQRQEEHRQHQQMELQQAKLQQQLLLQQQAQNLNKQGIPFSVDTITKILESQPAAPVSPVAALGMPNLFYGHFDRQNMTNLQRQREMLSMLNKQDQQSKPAPNILHAPKVPANKDVLMAPSTQTLGLPGVSPRQSPLPHDAMHPQGRIPSPLVFGQQPPALSHAPAPIHPNHLAQMVQNSANANTLQVQNPIVLQRGPSPQELAVHTQAILQNALIKRKLEEQKENFRKRQEAQRTNSPGLNNKSGLSPSPLKGMSPTIAFTPTSVMRKMQSEKNENMLQKPEAMQNGSNKLSSSTDSVPNNDQNNSKTAPATTVDTSLINVSGKSNPVPRPVYGQNMMNQNRTAFQGVNANPGINMAPSQGRPIVKGGNNAQGGINMIADAMRMPSNSGMKHNTMMHNKLLQQTRNEKFLGHVDREIGTDLNKVIEQQRLLQQQKSMAIFNQQRRQNSSPMSAVHATAFAFNPRSHGINPNMRPIIAPTAIPSANNLPYPMYRAVLQTNPTVAMRATTACPMTQLQLAALQQQMKRTAPESRQNNTRNFHPLALQQLFNPAAQNAANLGAHGDGKHLMPGKGGPNPRQSPVNLSKWFGTDVLQQKMPEMPPESHEKAVRLEDIERQPQHSTAVHN